MDSSFTLRDSFLNSNRSNLPKKLNSCRSRNFASFQKFCVHAADSHLFHISYDNFSGKFFFICTNLTFIHFVKYGFWELHLIKWSSSVVFLRNLFYEILIRIFKSCHFVLHKNVCCSNYF